MTADNVISALDLSIGVIAKMARLRPISFVNCEQSGVDLKRLRQITPEKSASVYESPTLLGRITPFPEK
jgi:hypothetical protein